MRILSLAISAALLASGVAAQTIDRIKENGEIRFGFRTDAAPLSFVDDQGRPAGYSPLICDQIARAVADELQIEGLNAQFVPVEPNNRFDMVAEGKVDLLCGAATITLKRREKVDFSIPTYVDGASVLLPNESGTDLKSLTGKKVGMRSGTTTEEAVYNSFGSAGIEVSLVRFASHPDGINALRSGEIDAYFADQSILLVNYIAAGMAGEFKLSQEILTIEKHGLAMARGDSEFRLMIDGILSQMYADGKMEQIFSSTLPGVEPGAALRALYVIAPTLR